MWQQREQRERLREAGGRRIKTIYMRFSKVLQLIFPSAPFILFYVVIDPYSYKAAQSTADNVAALSQFLLVVGCILPVFAMFFLFTHYIKIYENVLVCRRFFKRRILFANDIEYICLRSLAEVPLKNTRMDTFNWTAGSHSYFCIKPVNSKELRYSYRSYGKQLNALIDWQIEQQVPDSDGNILTYDE